jgi:hypothetical protein
MIDIASGVAAGILIAAAFLWCLRAANTPKPPLWALAGMLVVLAFIGLSVPIAG